MYNLIRGEYERDRQDRLKEEEMKIVTWNANMAFRKKQKIILNSLNPDVLLVQECEHPDKFDTISFPYFSWTGENRNKGLALFSKYKIDNKTVKTDSRWHLVFKINDIHFIGLWAINDKSNPQNRYIAQVWSTINHYKLALNGKIIVLGDFNWNIIWDGSPSYPLTGNFKNVVDLFEEHDIVSSYHIHNHEKYGSEKKPTLFMYRKKDKKYQYHVDYIFAKNELLKGHWQFNIGNYDDWIEYSDHMPLSLELK
jgi:exonuclease III